MRWLAVMAALLAGCVDFGYEVPQVEPAPPPSGAGGTSGGDCTEGEVAPSDQGPQVKFVAMNVDQVEIRVSAGDQISWTNQDSMPHSVVAGAPGAETPASAGGFSSPELATGVKWAFRFCTKRKAFYFCGKHPGQMTGYRVVVE